MHEMIKGIFKDAGATEDDLKIIEQTAIAVALQVRETILKYSVVVPPEMMLPMRVLLARVAHADMEKAFKQYETPKVPDDATKH